MRIKADINSTAAYTRSHSANDAKRKSVPPALWLRLALCLVTMALSGMLLYLVGNRLVSQIYYTKAKSALKGNHHWIAVQHLKAAIRYQPDDFMFWRKLADVYSTVGEQENSVQRAFIYADRARKAYLESNRLNPLEPSTVIGIALSEARLQQLYPYLYPGITNNPYNPLPYFKAAIKLRPNCIQYHFTLARYFHQTGRGQELLQVSDLWPACLPGCIWPKREPLWLTDVHTAVKKGLQEAIEEKIAVKEAHRSLSKCWPTSKTGRRPFFTSLRPFLYQKEISAGDYIQLGRLYLYGNKPEESIVSFYKSHDHQPG